MPGHIPGVFLDRLQGPALVGAHGVFAANVSGLINRTVEFIEEPPAVPGSLALVMRISAVAVGGDALQDLGRLVGAGQHVVQHVVVGRFHGIALTE